MSKKKLEETPLNNDENFNYDAYFGESKAKAKTYAQKTAIGEFRNPGKFSWVEWTFLVVSMVSFLAVIALNIERFVTFEKEFYNLTLNSSEADSSPRSCDYWYCTSDFVFTVCVTLNLVFCIFYCLDALFRERELELLTFIVACWVIAIYVIGNVVFDYFTDHYKPTAVKIVRLALVCVCVPVITVLAIIVYHKMGFLILNVIGSNKKLTRAYYVRAFFETLQYFNVQIMANVLVLSYAMNGDFITLAEKIVLIVFLVLLILVSFCGYIAVTWEITWAAIAWYFLMIPFEAFYIYKLIMVSLDWSKYVEPYVLMTEEYDTDTSFIGVGISLLLASALGIFAVIILAIAMAIAMKNFKVGLKDKTTPPFSRCVKHIRT